MCFLEELKSLRFYFSIIYRNASIFVLLRKRAELLTCHEVWLFGITPHEDLWGSCGHWGLELYFPVRREFFSPFLEFVWS
jgi:hypothetical protein